MSTLTNCVPCPQCIFAIYEPRDIFTGKPRYFCGKGICEIDEYGDQTLFCDIVGGGCQEGIKRTDDPAMSSAQCSYQNAIKDSHFDNNIKGENKT